MLCLEITLPNNGRSADMQQPAKFQNEAADTEGDGRRRPEEINDVEDLGSLAWFVCFHL